VKAFLAICEKIQRRFMVHHNNIDSSFSENIEMYLVRVAQLRQDDQPVPISQLAQELAVTSVSANEMYRKLVEKG